LNNYTFGKRGTLYFMSEQDRFTSDRSDYVKIGIVTGDRDVTKREREHQTGNPRTIFSLENLESAGVQMLETFMHNFYSKIRVKGEWFRADSNQIEAMIDEASNRATELFAYEDDLDFAEKLKGFDGPRWGEAEIGEAEVHGMDVLPQQLFELEDRLKVLRQLKTRVSKSLLGFKDKADFPFDMLKVASRAEAETFSTTEAKKLFPDLALKFAVGKSSWAYSFLRPVDFVDEHSSQDLDSYPLDTTDPIELHDQYLHAWSQIAEAQWKYQVIEAQLLVYSGEDCESVSINGETILRWERKSRSVFDQEGFKEAHPEEAALCTKKSEAKETASIAEWRAYKV
jgi:hypothetical protein